LFCDLLFVSVDLMSVPNLNLDVYTHLLSFISSPGDLLAFSLANKQLRAIAEPELIYRSIRCRLDNDAIWKHVIANPALASRVRVLEIQRENETRMGSSDEKERVPKLYHGAVGQGNGPMWSPPPSREQDEGSERLLIKAIRVMVNLESFMWDWCVPFINVGEKVSEREHVGEDHDPETYQEDMWTTLRDHTQLRKIHVLDLGIHRELFPNRRPIFFSSVSRFLPIRVLVLTSTFGGI
jgi:hypothetical protein